MDHGPDSETIPNPVSIVWIYMHRAQVQSLLHAAIPVQVEPLNVNIREEIVMSTRRSFLTQAAAGTVLSTASSRAADPVAAGTTVGTRIRTSRIPHTDLMVSRIAFGASAFGSDIDVARMINTIYDEGITFFDHADIYGEEPFGQALRQSPGLRNKIVIQTKCGVVVPQRSQVSATDLFMDCSRDHIISAAEGSLRRLGIDHLDVLLLHWPDALVEPGEVAEAFDKLEHSGKVRYFGVSNHTPSQIDLLRKHVRQRLVANQIYLALENACLIVGGLAVLGEPAAVWGNTRNPYNSISAVDTIDYCRLHEMQIQAWSPLQGDLLRPRADTKPEIKHAAQVLADLAKTKNTTPAAVALAWLMRHPAGIVPIISSTKPEHVREDCAADRVFLSREEWYTLLNATKPESRMS